jgi:hypothetical protein
MTWMLPLMLALFAPQDPDPASLFIGDWTLGPNHKLTVEEAERFDPCVRPVTMTAVGPGQLEISSRRAREVVTVTRDGDTFLWWSERYEGARRVRFTEDGALLIAYRPDHPIDERAVYRARCPRD